MSLHDTAGLHGGVDRQNVRAGSRRAHLLLILLPLFLVFLQHHPEDVGRGRRGRVPARGGVQGRHQGEAAAAAVGDRIAVLRAEGVVAAALRRRQEVTVGGGGEAGVDRGHRSLFRGGTALHCTGSYAATGHDLTRPTRSPGGVPTPTAQLTNDFVGEGGGMNERAVRVRKSRPSSPGCSVRHESR